MSSSSDQLKIGAHVLIQLGSELVTDSEQAILECVKNSYDADAGWCRIEIDTRESGAVEESGLAALRRFNQPFETVSVEILDTIGRPVLPNTKIAADASVKRRLHYTGRITIEDNGDGLSLDKVRDSWLVISNSNKRAAGGFQKRKTKRGRTPLGDKGLGRLGSMKLGDVLRIETSTGPEMPIAVAQFRWTDCEIAGTVDEIPVYTQAKPNLSGFKGTRVSILGLRDLPDWQRKDRIHDLTRSLAKLISPFEATSTFPVGISLDGADHSLVTITDELLKRAVAEFSFSWEFDETLKENVLVAKAHFQKRLFMSTRSQKLAERTELVFGVDHGAKFAEYLPTYSRLKKFNVGPIELDGQWFVQLNQKYRFSELRPQNAAPTQDPGPFKGAFFFFHLDNVEGADEGAAAGLGIDKKLIKSMSGIAILRDGFRVRSHGDWLDISSGMTSGSTYNMRVDNTVGYFSLTGEKNYLLTEKSDREGFVEDAAYRGFLEIASKCKDFANDSLEQVRRALDDYARGRVLPKDAPMAPTPEASFEIVGQNLRSAREARAEAERAIAGLTTEIAAIESDQSGERSGASSRAIKTARSAVKTVEALRSKLSAGKLPDFDLLRLKHEYDIRSEQMLSLLESAAVGLSARGLAHELRTHLTEIRQQVSTIEKSTKKLGGADAIVSSLRSIRASCSAISNAAALIDPMLPKARSIKQVIDLKTLVEEYTKTRTGMLDRAGIQTKISGAGRTVRANRSLLIQVIDNLVRNSIYWLRREEASGEQSRAKTVGFDLTGQGFNVWDSGPGVDPRVEDSLFEMFVTSKPNQDGQGLGLFIVRQLLQNQGCDITLLEERNAKGRRYKFAVNLSSLLKA